jgi:hypothetical protein
MREIHMKRFALLLALLMPASGALAAEGMYTLDHLPRAELKKKYGFAPDQAWADKVMRASVRLAGGCSGSFVSKDGLVMTNHHCANQCIQQLSTAKKDYIRDGFLAKTRGDEAACPEVEINRLEQITDVTARMKAATKGKSGKAFSDAEKAEKSRIEAECVGQDSAATRCDVVELYHGGLFDLYKYHRFQDVRLVFAPEKDIAFFGGDPDNFNFPRYDLDLSLLRAYENGKPAQVAEYFPFSKDGAQDGELTMVTGHPGSTERQLTLAQLERLRDVDMPMRLFRLAEMRGMLNQYATAGGEPARVSQDHLFSVENSFKAIYGEFQALLDPAVMKDKAGEERALRAYAKAHPKLGAADAWDAIANAQGVYRNIQLRWRMLEAPRAFWSTHFDIARMLVRGAEERGKPNAERLREYTESKLPSMTQDLFSAAPIYPDYEKVKLAWSLTKMREWLGADDPTVKAVLGSESPEHLAARLVDRTKLSDVGLRKKLWEGGREAIDKSTDPFIELARKVDAEARALRKRYEEEIEAVEKQGAEKIARVRFAKEGTNVYPDATFTLRLSYGEVKGWKEGERTVEPFTTFEGAYARHTGSWPFALPESWLDAKSRVKPAQRFNFVTTNDIIGGNSGSPLINRDAEVVGLVFDGNIHSLGGAFWFDERLNRCVAVHSGAIIEALRNIYNAGALADEMTAR